MTCKTSAANCGAARIDRRLRETARQRRTAFIPSIVLGDPNPTLSQSVLETAAAEADMLEVILPFSDPACDPDEIALAQHRALCGGADRRGAFRLIAEVRDRHPDLPILLSASINLAAVPGPALFFKEAAEAGADAVFIPELSAAMRAAESFWDEEAARCGLLLTGLAAVNTPSCVRAELARRSPLLLYVLDGIDIPGARPHQILLADRRGLDGEDAVISAARSRSAAGCSGVAAGSALARLIRACEGNDAELLERMQKMLRQMKAALRFSI